MALVRALLVGAAAVAAAASAGKGAAPQAPPAPAAAPRDPAAAAPPAPKPLRDPIAAAQGVISRVVGDFFLYRVQLEVIPADPATGNDVFELAASDDGSKLVIRGNSGVALSSGLGWWLKHYTNSSWSWGRSGSGNLIQVTPHTGALPLPEAPVRMVSPARWRYSSNVCTFGYSYAWWGLEQWMEELDRQALWGVNLPLAFIGQEYVWTQLYQQFNLTLDDLAPFFSGPAFLPWQRMGNMRGLGGPLTQDWMLAQRDLQVRPPRALTRHPTHVTNRPLRRAARLYGASIA